MPACRRSRVRPIRRVTSRDRDCRVRRDTPRSQRRHTELAIEHILYMAALMRCPGRHARSCRRLSVSPWPSSSSELVSARGLSPPPLLSSVRQRHAGEPVWALQQPKGVVADGDRPMRAFTAAGRRPTDRGRPADVCVIYPTPPGHRSVDVNHLMTAGARLRLASTTT
jgi:hypothetical protein